MISLRLVDGRSGEVLALHPRSFRKLEALYVALRKPSGWRRGGLHMSDTPGSGPHFHIWAEAFDASGVVARWIWMEIRTIECIVGPNGCALPGTDQVTARHMAWTRVDEAAARGFLEVTA